MVVDEDLPQLDSQVRDAVSAIHRSPKDAQAVIWKLAEALLGKRWRLDADGGRWYPVHPSSFDDLSIRVNQRVVPLAELTVAYLQGDGTDFADELLTACDKYLQTRGIEQDGPVSPMGFRFNGKVYDGVPPKVSATLAHLWHRRSQTSTWAKLADPVWGDHGKEVTEGMIRGIQTQATNYFDSHAVPIRIRREFRGRTVRVERPPE